MRIKVKILLLTVSTLVLILCLSAYYTHKVVEKNREASLKEEASKIVRRLAADVSSSKDTARLKTINENFQEMLYINPRNQTDTSAHVAPYGQRRRHPDNDAASLDALNESIEEMMHLNSHIVRVDFLALHEDGTLKPFFTKIKKDIPRFAPSTEELSIVKNGGISIDIEEISGASYVNISAPLSGVRAGQGLMQVKISREEYDNLLLMKKKGTVIIAALTIALIGGVLVVSLNLMVNKPIENLLSAITRIKNGDLSATVAPAANDEIGRLTGHFNDMMEAIRKNAKEKEGLLGEINRHNDELRTRVGEATEELNRRNDELSRANRSIYNIQKKLGHSRRLAAVGQLAATVAHELGTPLHSISGHVQLLLEEPDLTVETRRRLAIMQSQVERITGSIQNILNTTRQPDESLDLVDLNRLLDDIAILVLPETMSKQITLRKEFSSGLPPVSGSRSRLEVVFLNLVDNAIDASSQGGVISISTSLSTASDGLVPPQREEASKAPWLRVAVSDNGCGIPEAEIGRIFEPFFTTKAHGHGIGLGLAVTREIVHGYNGAISARSLINAGSTFTVFLPAADNGGMI